MINFMNFYSHTPCGVRPLEWYLENLEKQFLLTHPMRGATRLFSSSNAFNFISTHTPHAGCDFLISFSKYVWENFYSHTPCGVRQISKMFKRIQAHLISTHTPHAGCDLTVQRFQLRH